MSKLTFILGGARSGKSAYAEKLAHAHGGPVLYVATAEALDEEMRQRIQHHRQRRPSNWQTLEAPRDTARAILDHSAGGGVVLLDCLTLLASNVIAPLPEPLTADAAERALDAEVDAILEAVKISRMDWIIVSNELGLGVVPAYPLGRIFRDAVGRANQRIAAAADVAVFMVAGLPLSLKQS